MSEKQVTEFKRLVSDIAAQLNPEEVERLAYIHLRGSQSTDKYNAKDPGATALNLLTTLESLGKFSQQNVDGLLVIAEDAHRRDLIGKVEEYKAKRSRAKEYPGKKPRNQLHEDQQLRDKKTVAKFEVLQKNVSLLQRSLSKRIDAQDEAFVLLHSMEDTLHNLTSSIQQPNQVLNLASRSRNDSSSSSSNESGGVSEGSTASSTTDTDTTPTLQEMPIASGETKKLRKKPVPKKRSNFPIQESSASSVQLSHPLECQDKEPAGYAHSMTSGKPQIRPRKIPTQSTAGSTDSPVIVSQLPNRGTDEVEDVTGDSGMGTGSETGPYSTVDIWRQAMNNPPPQATQNQLPDQTYQPIISENREPDHTYQPITYESREPDTV